MDQHETNRFSSISQAARCHELDVPLAGDNEQSTPLQTKD
jgi:hypothetical protein